MIRKIAYSGLIDLILLWQWNKISSNQKSFQVVLIFVLQNNFRLIDPLRILSLKILRVHISEEKLYYFSRSRIIGKVRHFSYSTLESYLGHILHFLPLKNFFIKLERNFDLTLEIRKICNNWSIFCNFSILTNNIVFLQMFNSS